MNRRLWSVAIGAGVAASLVFMVAVVDPLAPDRAGLLRPDDTKVTAVGERIYVAHCAACHGARLEGQPNWRERGADGRLPAPPHDATGHTWHHADEVLVRITKFGVAKAVDLPSYVTSMPVYAGVLTDAEILAALSWIKSQWPADIRARHDRTNRSAEKRR
jgi:mono/diheme cytochrome c family protein